MSIRFYNTLTKKKEEFISIEKNRVRMYTCGPTVYNYFHIGNARSFLMSDVIRRYLEYRGYEVKYVMNITDVDDKIINKANESNKTTKEITDEYTQAFFDDINNLGIKRASVNPKATEHIQEIINLIKRLVDKGTAYQVNNDVYYSIEKFKSYGKLSGKNISDLIAGARVDVGEIKRNPLDFSLWKGMKPNEPFWESPWGKGRPSWHIECSAMAMKYLGETIDIHCGGNDLIFPHHENEIAQSETCNEKPFSNYWIHFGFLNLDNEKMSKSKGNIFTTRDILSKYPANVLKFYYLQTHYASPLNFTDEGLEGAKNGFERLQNSISELKRRKKENKYGQIEIEINDYENRFIEAMDDDINSPKGMSVLFDLVKQVNLVLQKEEGISEKGIKSVLSFFDRTFSGVFGLNASETTSVNIPDSILSAIVSKKENFYKMLGVIFSELNKENVDLLLDKLVEKRKEAKTNKNWKLADQIRDELKQTGILLEDKKDGSTIWKIE
jgi:cysteinyl-tRNA synthetase